jgi:hypothetical protein
VSESKLGADGHDRECKHGRSRPVIAQDVPGRLNFSLTKLSTRAEEKEKIPLILPEPFLSGATGMCSNWSKFKLAIFSSQRAKRAIGVLPTVALETGISREKVS